MTKKEAVKLKRWEWIKRQSRDWKGADKRLSRKIRRAFNCVSQFYQDNGLAINFFPVALEDDFALIPGKRYRWIIEEMDELPDGLVAPKK